MNYTLYPKNEPPITSRSLRGLWNKATEISGRLSGMDVSDDGINIVIDSGSFISNGTIVTVTETTVEMTDVPGQPYYLCGYFGGASRNNVPEIVLTKTISLNHALIATMEFGVWTMAKIVSPTSLELTSNNHSSDMGVHITEDQNNALALSNSPSKYNLFLKESDLTHGSVISKNELSVISMASSGTFFNMDIPDNKEDNLIVESFGTIRGGYVPRGVYGRIDEDNTTAVKCGHGLSEDIFKDPIVSNSVSFVSFGRLDTVISEDGAPNNSDMLLMTLGTGLGPAMVSWDFGQFGSDLSSIEDYIYTTFNSSSVSGLSSVSMYAYDGTNYSENKFSLLAAGKWAPIYVNMSDLDKTAIKSICIKFYFDQDQSGTIIKLDSLYNASSVQTYKLRDAGKMASVRIEPLAHRKSIYDGIISSISMDNGATYIPQITPGVNYDLKKFNTPAVSEVMLRFGIMNLGGNFSTAAAEWPDQRKSYAMFSDSRSNVAVIIGGVNNNILSNSSIVYKKSIDSMLLGMDSPMVRAHSTGYCSIGEVFDITGGINGVNTLDDHYGIYWRSQTSVKMIDMPFSSYNHGCAPIRGNGMIVWQGSGCSSVAEYRLAGDSWTTLTSSVYSGQSKGVNSNGSLYGGRGGSVSTGMKFDMAGLIWSSISLDNMPSYANMASVGSGYIVSQSSIGVNDRSTAYDPVRDIERNVSCNTTGAGNSGNAVYVDDTISYGPWEKDGIYNTDHNIFTLQEVNKLNGFCLKYTEE